MFCIKCGNELSNTARFCTSCGTKVTLQRSNSTDDTSGHRRGQTSSDDTSNYTAKRFNISFDRTDEIQSSLLNYLSIQNYETQVMDVDNGVLIQAAKKGNWRKFVGMKSTSNIVIEPHDSSLIVKIGAGKWLDKAITGGVGMFLFWPLAVTTGVGVFEQKQFPKKVFAYIESLA